MKVILAMQCGHLGNLEFCIQACYLILTLKTLNVIYLSLPLSSPKSKKLKLFSIQNVGQNNKEVENCAAQDFEMLNTMRATKHLWVYLMHLYFHMLHKYSYQRKNADWLILQ